MEQSEQTKKLRFERYSLPLILVLALATRVAVLGVAWRSDSAAAPVSSDSASYLAPALSLATEGTFKTDQQLEILRTPGYPAFLVACAFTGRLGYGIAQIVQILLDVLLVYLTYLLGTRLVHRAAGLWAAALQACSVLAITSSPKILSDGLFALLINIAVLYIVRHIRIGGLQPLAVGAVATAAATYVRPVGFIFVPVVALILLFRPRRFVSVASFVVVFVALVTPWFVRNYTEAGYLGFSSIGDYNLLFYEGAAVWAKSHGLSTLQAREQLDKIYRQRLLVEAIEPGSTQAIRVQRQMGNTILLSYPATFLRVHVATSLNCLLPAGTGLLEMLGVTAGNRGTLSVLQTKGLWAATKYYFGSNLIAAALMVPDLIFLAIQYVVALAYALKQLGLRGFNWGAAGWLVVLTIVAFVMVAGPAAVPRFRLPVEPLINVAAGAGVAMLLSRGKVLKEGTSLVTRRLNCTESYGVKPRCAFYVLRTARGSSTSCHARMTAPVRALFFLSASIGATVASAVTPAFPGAEGGGAGSVGGRGGAVCEVTNLNDSGPNSLRDCATRSGPRTVVFRVGGVIQVLSDIVISNPYITIAGQTAPGGGIMLEGTQAKSWSNGLRMIFVATHDVVIRYLRVRPGPNQAGGGPTNGTVGIAVMNADIYNVIIDHLSISWTDNKPWILYSNYGPGVHNLTYQWSMDSEGLGPTIGRPKSQSVGGGSGNSNGTFPTYTDDDYHHNFMSNHSHRMLETAQHTMRMVNNIIYNWSYFATQTQGPQSADIIGNLFKPGPLTSGAYKCNGNPCEILVDPGDAPGAPAGNPSLYLLGNKGPNQPVSVGNQWIMANRETCFQCGPAGVVPAAWQRSTPLATLQFPISIDGVENLENVVLPTVGASQKLNDVACDGTWVPNRDSVDARLINEYQAGIGLIPRSPSDVGGYPTIPSGTPCSSSLHDGIADHWKVLNGLSTTDRSLYWRTAPNGYTYLEHYLNGMTVGHVGAAVAERP